MRTISLFFYRLLLKIYPAGFRENYAGPLEREFRDELAEARDRSGLLRLWLRTLRDLLVSAPAQIAREIGQDSRHAVRLWARRPLHTALAMLALAIGIGANTGVFSVVNSLLLRSLPFREAERVAVIKMFSPTGLNARPTAFHRWRSSSSYLADAARFNSSEVNLGEARGAARVRLTEASSNFFSMLGAAPVLGRDFAAGEDTPGQDAVAVIGYGLWQQLFGGDARALGTTIRLNGTPLTVIGIAPAGFDYPRRSAVWTPTTFDWDLVPKAGVNFLENIGRLRPEMNWAQARQAFEAEAYASDPERRTADAANRPALVPLREQLAGPLKPASMVLMCGVGLILLIACVNVANLMLARTLDRANELRIRGALGAGRGRLTQQLLTESLLLATVAATFGLLVAGWTARVAAAAQPAPLAGQDYTLLDWRVLAFTVGISLATAVVFGAAPAIYGRRASLLVRGSGGPGMGRTRNVLMAAQVALTVMLLVGAVALGRAFVQLLGVDNGYAVRDVVTLSVSLAGSTHEGDDRSSAYLQEALDRVRRVPAVVGAGATEFMPLATSSFMGGRYTIEGRGAPAFAVDVPVTPGYFATLGGRILHGRDFESRDARSAEPLVIVNEELARGFGEPGAAVGRLLLATRGKPARIIGVAQGMRFGGPMYPVQPQVFRVSVSPAFLTVVAKTRGDVRDAIPAIRAAVQSIDPKIPVFNVKTMDERLAEALARPRFYAIATFFFGGFVVLLAVIGVYGVVSYAVLQRKREMGIRMALGATPGGLRSAIVWRSMLVVASGAAPGVLAGIATRRYLQALIAGAGEPAPQFTVAAVALVGMIAAASAWIATRHVARLDIADVVRAD